MLPNYLHIGASKCKSSWLYRVCQAHPEIYVPGDGYDNVNFFVNGYHRGLGWYERTFFAGAGDEPVVGEFSNSYMVFEPALERIERHLPDVKLTMTLMNPVHRIFYSWAHRNLKKKCRFRGEGVSRVELEARLRDQGLDSERGIVLPPSFLLHHHGHAHFTSSYGGLGCHYAHRLDSIWRRFGRERVKVMFYEDLLADREAFLRDYFAFLGVDEGFRCDLRPEEVNPDPSLVEHEQWFPPALRREWIEVLRPDVEQLQAMLGRDLGHWLDDERACAMDYCRRWR